jgi:hypothetical protein
MAMAAPGCGASSSGPVASVQGTAISRRALDRWTAIKRAESQASGALQAPTPAVLRGRALTFLITAAWLEKEAAAEGVGAPQSEVEATYERLLTSPAGPAFAAGLRRRGVGHSEELLALRLDALAQKLRAKIASAHPRSSLLALRSYEAAFIAAYRQRWRARTDCRPGYVVAECRNGPPLPEAPRPAR